MDTASTKTCPHCRKEVDAKAKRCPFCQADLRNWVNRHPVATILLVLILGGIALSSLSGSAPSSSSQTGTTQDTVKALMAGNNPSIKELSTLPTNYIGKTFTLYAYAEDARYYNYGFQDENSWYSLRLSDDSSSNIFDEVYAYLPKTAANKELVDQALNAPVFIKAIVSIPQSHWEDGSNAFLEINSWSFQ